MLEEFSRIIVEMQAGFLVTEEVRGKYTVASGRKVVKADAVGAWAIGRLDTQASAEVNAFLDNGGWFDVCNAYYHFFGRNLVSDNDAFGREYVLDTFAQAVSWMRGVQP